MHHMSEIEFTCNQCRQWLSAPSRTAGLLVECPACHSVMAVPERQDTVTIETPVPENDAPAQSGKSATVRIELPPNLGLPPAAPPRRIVIRRKT